MSENKVYIEKEAAVNFAARGYLCIADALGEEPNESNCFVQIAEIRDFLRNIPAADVKPVVRGEWVRDPQTGLCVCSNCDKVAPYTVHADWIEYWPVLDFCNACGADMRKEERR